MDGILNICKPRGLSSFKALSIVKNKLANELGVKPKQLKVGHLGTLDPLAMGILILMFGKATKLANVLHAPQKIYRFLWVASKTSDTLDDEGEITATTDVIPTQEQIMAILPQMVGDIEIEVPKYSAVHIDGKRAYDLARKGVDFVPPKKVVKIDRFEMLTFDDCRRDMESIGETYTPQPHSFYFEVECQTGTYIRSLAKLLADKLGTLALASIIIRTKVGEFDIKDSKRLDDVTLGDLQDHELS